MGDIGVFIRGNGIQKKDFVDTGIPCIHYGQLYTFYDLSASETKSYISIENAKGKKMAERGDLVIATTSENESDVCKAVAWLGEEPVAVSGDAYIYRHEAEPRFLAHFFESSMFQGQKKRFVTGTKVLRVSGDSMAKIHIALPSLERQAEIADVLDQFNALARDIKVGLPAEIDARRKQYAYYRNKLLTFKEKAA